MTERANEKDRSLAALTPLGAPKARSGEGGPSADNAQDALGVGGWTLGVPPAPDDEGVSTRRFVPGYVFASRYRMITRIGQGLDSIGLRRSAYLLAFLENDSSAMARELNAARSTTATMWTSSLEARASLF